MIGGSAVNVSPADCFDYLEADYAIVGEGEEAMVRLLAALGGAEPLAEVPGLLIRGRRSDKLLPILDTGRLAKGEPLTGRALVHDFDGAPRSRAYRWVDLEKYAAHGAPYSIQTKRGCALKCSYCVYNNIEGHAYWRRSGKNVVDEIEEVVREYGVRRVDFVDSTFNLPLYHAREILDELASRALPVELSTMGLNPAGVTRDLILAMKRAGFKNVMCTPESASDVTLKTLNKGFQKHAVVRAAEALRDAGMPTYWFFMLGAPGETLDTVRETLEFCEQHIPPTDMVLFSTGIRVYAGTPLEKTCKAMGWASPRTTRSLSVLVPVSELDLNELYSVLVRAAEAHPNWMTNAETVASPAMQSLLKGALRAFGMEGAFLDPPAQGVFVREPRRGPAARARGARRNRAAHHRRASSPLNPATPLPRRLQRYRSHLGPGRARIEGRREPRSALRHEGERVATILRAESGASLGALSPR